MLKTLRYVVSLFFSLITIVGYSQCDNDICETAIELTLCVNQELSLGCTTDWFGGDINLYGTGSTGGCNYQSFQFDEDQWFTFTLENQTQIVIDLNTNYQAPLGSSPCPVNLNGTTQGINLIMWAGNSCSDMFPIINTWNPSWCNGSYVIPQCPYSFSVCGSECSTNSNLPFTIDPTHPAYISTAYWNYSCCVNWFSSCQNYYNQQLLQYNLSLQNWVYQYSGQPADGVIGGVNPQDYLINMILPEGQYWIQLDPISCNPNTGGYSSQGSGTINVCELFFLNFQNNEQPELTNETDKEIKIETRFEKIIHPRLGLLLHDRYRDKFYDLSMRQVFIR
jgi:hypothetical protein